MTRCSSCGREFDRQGKDACVASISGSVMGDEYTESYFYCGGCGVYTVEVCHDRFLGEEELFARGPVPKAEGDAQVLRIRECGEPWDKKCRCAAHRAYFGDSLD